MSFIAVRVSSVQRKQLTGTDKDNKNIKVIYTVSDP